MEATVIDLSLTVFLHYRFGMLSYLPASHDEPASAAAAAWQCERNQLLSNWIVFYSQEFLCGAMKMNEIYALALLKHA